MLHDLFTQAAVPWGSEQTLPHLPQLLMSLLRSAQPPLQQVWPAGQTWPHAPQLAVSLERLKQNEPQGENPVLQVALQAPLTQ
jgi:hypothetical protein